MAGRVVAGVLGGGPGVVTGEGVLGGGPGCEVGGGSPGMFPRVPVGLFSLPGTVVAPVLGGNMLSWPGALAPHGAKAGTDVVGRRGNAGAVVAGRHGKAPGPMAAPRMGAPGPRPGWDTDAGVGEGRGP